MESWRGHLDIILIQLLALSNRNKQTNNTSKSRPHSRWPRPPDYLRDEGYKARGCADCCREEADGHDFPGEAARQQRREQLGTAAHILEE